MQDRCAGASIWVDAKEQPRQLNAATWELIEETRDDNRGTIEGKNSVSKHKEYACSMKHGRKLQKETLRVRSRLELRTSFWAVSLSQHNHFFGYT
jgi:hypothetical protein